MSDDRSIAANVLETAHRVVTTERGNQHGSAENSFEMIADFWAVFLRHTHKHRHGIHLDLRIMPSDVAEMMSLLKKARGVYGDPGNPDNAVDDVGYTALAEMLRRDDEIRDLARLAEQFAPKRGRTPPATVDTHDEFGAGDNE